MDGERPLPSKAFYAPAMPNQAARSKLNATTQFFFPFQADSPPPAHMHAARAPQPPGSAAGAHHAQGRHGGAPPSTVAVQQLRAAQEERDDARATITVLRRRLAAAEEEMRETQREHRERVLSLQDEMRSKDQLISVLQQSPERAMSPGGGADAAALAQARQAADAATRDADAAYARIAELESELAAAQQSSAAAAPAPAARPKRGGVVVDLDSGSGGGSAGGMQSGQGLARTPPRATGADSAVLREARAEVTRLELALAAEEETVADLKRKLAGEASARQIAEGRLRSVEAEAAAAKQALEKAQTDLADMHVKRDELADQVRELGGKVARAGRRPPPSSGAHRQREDPVRAPAPHAPAPAAVAVPAEEGAERRMLQANANARAANARRQMSSGFSLGGQGSPGETRQRHGGHQDYQAPAPPPVPERVHAAQWAPTHPAPQYPHHEPGAEQGVRPPMGHPEPWRSADVASPQDFAVQDSTPPRTRQQGTLAPDEAARRMHMMADIAEAQRRDSAGWASQQQQQQQQPASTPQYVPGATGAVPPPTYRVSSAPQHQQAPSAASQPSAPDAAASELMAQFAAARARAASGGHGAPPHQAQSPKDHANAAVKLRAAAAPFATEASLSADLAAVGDVQSKLLSVNQARDRVKQELAKTGPGMGRSMSERRQKADLESRLLQLEGEASRLRAWLKQHEYS